MATGTDTLPLIRTKLYRPRITGDLVPRPRLLERLEQRRDRPLTLVVAPAGYGKSTLVSNWLDTCGCPSAWLSLDENDNDLPLFLSYFSAAIRTMFPGALEETRGLLQAASLPPLDVLARSLINDLDRIEPSFILVLDDYHSVHNVNVHLLITELLHHPPRSLHLVLASRSDPPLPLVRLRARGQATEIRTQALRFTEAETALFLAHAGMQVDEGRVRTLVERVEGWVTGMRLAVLSARHRGSEDLTQARLESSISYITDYLVAEVLAGQPPSIQDYLLRTSILERFCAPLCEAVQFGKAELPSSSSGTAVSLVSSQGAPSPAPQEAGEAGPPALSGQAYLDWLEASDLFVVPLDDRHEWYRYHHLFQQLLRNQLQRRCGPEEIAAIHARASAWYAQNDLIDEALSHALSAGDDLGATQLVERYGRVQLNEDQWHVLAQWMAKLPQAIIQQRPQLLILSAWVSFYQFALGAIPPLLETLERMLDGDVATEALQGEVDFFWGHHWYWLGESARSQDLLSRALERIPVAYHSARAEAELFWGLASQMVGQQAEAVQRLERIAQGEPPPPPGRQMRLLGALVFVHLLSGELTRAAQAASQMQAIATESNIAYYKGWVSYLQGYIHYAWNELELAFQHFAQAVEGRYILHTRAAIDSVAGLALTQQSMQQPAQARATMDLLLEFAQQAGDPSYVAVARSCQARLALLQGDLAVALRWLRAADPAAGAGIMFYWLEVPRVTQCRVLIAQGSAASLQEAGEILQVLERVKEARHNTRQLIDILLLLALALQKQGQTDRALATLERAVALADPGGWIRPFVELGPAMASLLGQLHGRDVAAGFVAQVWAAFKPETATPRPGPSAIVAGTQAPGPSEPVVEPLTNRELEVLELMAQRLTNKEIAARLVLSVGTVKQHAYNINQKLNVKGRRQAVAKATSLGILTPS